MANSDASPSIPQRSATSAAPVTLTIDVGGQGIKALVYEGTDTPRGERVRVKTPRPAKPDEVLEVITTLLETMLPYDRIAVGFPGVVIDGVVHTAPNLDGKWTGVRLQEKIVQHARLPARVINDADLQGFGAIQGRGLEMLITLGTGMGASLFINGQLVPNLELGHHPFEKGATYEERLGQAALDKAGKASWVRRVNRAVELMRRVFNFDTLYVGGGNARYLKGALPPDVVVVKNAIAFAGGARLWQLESQQQLPTS